MAAVLEPNHGIRPSALGQRGHFEYFCRGGAGGGGQQLLANEGIDKGGLARAVRTGYNKYDFGAGRVQILIKISLDLGVICEVFGQPFKNLVNLFQRGLRRDHMAAAVTAADLLFDVHPPDNLFQILPVCICT